MNNNLKLIYTDIEASSEQQFNRFRVFELKIVNEVN